MSNLYMFIRSFETAIGVFGLLLALAKHHKDFKTRSLIFGIVSIIICGLLTLAFAYTNQYIAERISLPILILVMLFGLIYTTTDRWKVRLFNLFSGLSVYMMISFLSGSLAFFAPEESGDGRYLLYRAVLFAAAIFIEYRYVRKPFRRMVDIVQSEWNIVNVVAGVFLILNVLLNIYPDMYYRRPAYAYVQIAAAYILMVAVYCCIYVVLHNVVLRYGKEQTDATVRLKVDALERQIELQKSAAEAVRRTRHDLRHNCLVAIGQITGGNYEEAVEYLRQFTDLIEQYSIKNYCSNSSVNCILSALSERAENVGIIVEIKANVPDKLLKIDEVELASLFANAFENAVEGCISAEAETAFVAFTADYSDNRVLLSVKNPCGEVEFADGLPVSTKPGGGTGTRSIKYIAEKYHGMAEFSKADSVFSLQAYLLDE